MENSDNLFSILTNKFRPFWPLFVALLVIGLIGAKIYLGFTTPLYESSAALIVNDEKKGVDESQLMESFNVFESKKIVENEIEVLRSKDIIEDVVINLGLYSSIHKSGFFGSTNAFMETPVLIRLKDPMAHQFYEIAENVHFTYDSKKKSVIIDNKSLVLNTWVKNPIGGSELMFIANQNSSGYSDGDYFYTLQDPRSVVKQVLGNLYVGAASKLSTVVRLTFLDEIPERGNAILDQLIISYKKASIDVQNSLASNTLEFVETRMVEVGEQLEAVEKELEKYRSSEGVIDLSEQGSIYLLNVGEYDRRIGDINLQLSVLNKVESYVVSKNKNSGIVPSTLGIDDPILSQLLQRLYDAEIEYEQLRKTTAENNPILVAIRNRIAKIRPSILENVRSQKSNLQASRGSLTSNSGKYNDALQVLPEQERKFVEITRRKKSISDLYDYLVQKREETALSYAPNVGNVRVIEKAESSIKPVSPRKSLAYLIGLIVAIGLGLVWVTARELLSSKVLFRSELESYSDIPILGELAHLDKPLDELLVTSHKDIFITDQFRHIVSNLGVYKYTNPVKSIMVTSSVAGEGKSYISANLATTVALSGKKTALVDMDLRKAGVSEIFGMEDRPGISDLLLENCSTKEIRVREAVDLYVFPSGKKIMNSSELLANGKLDEFMQELFQTFDFVVIDSPPASMVTDAALLADYCDRTVFVVRHDNTPKFMAKRIDKIISEKGFKHCGLVFNGVKPRGLTKQNYGYGYGYEPIENENTMSIIQIFKEKYSNLFH